MRPLLTLWRTVFTWVIGVLATIVFAIAVVIIAVFDDTSIWIERVIRTWSRLWLFASGTRLELEGTENVDQDRSYVVVANHLSSLDIMACFLAVRLPIRYLAKKELFRIPILAQGMRAIGIIEVDRAARSAVHGQVNKQAKVLVEKRRSLIIYAEGTRPRDGSMKPFKKGAFTMAIDSGLPVLPVSIHGTYQAMTPGTPWVRGGPVHVIVDPAIETDAMDLSAAGDLRDRVYQVIQKRVSGMGGAVG